MSSIEPGRLIAIYIGLAVIISTIVGLISWGIYESVKNDTPVVPPVTSPPTRPPVTNPPVTNPAPTTTAPTMAPIIGAPTSVPIIDATPFCGPGTKPNIVNGVAKECVINPLPLSELSPKIDTLINTKRILPVRGANVIRGRSEWRSQASPADTVRAMYVEPSQPIVPNTPNEPIQPWYAQWLESGGETCTKTISDNYDETKGVGCACGDCAGWRGGTAINCSGASITPEGVDSEHRVYCRSVQNKSACACAGGYCPMGGLCVHPFKPRVAGGKRGCPSCITTPKSQKTPTLNWPGTSQCSISHSTNEVTIASAAALASNMPKGGCAGTMVCDPNEPLIENLVEYPGKRYECKLGALDDNYYYDQLLSQLNYTSQASMDADCTESDEYRGVNEYQCAWECIRKYNNQEECSKKCLPKLYTWGKINLNGQLQGYYQLPKLTQYLRECKTDLCNSARNSPMKLSTLDASVYLTNAGTTPDQMWRINLVTGDGLCAIQSVRSGNKLKCRSDDAFDSNNVGLADRGRVSVCCDDAETTTTCTSPFTFASYKCPQGSTRNGIVAKVTYGSLWRLVPYSESESLYYIVNDMTGFKMWINEKGVFASKREYPGVGTCVEIFKKITDGNNNIVFQAYVPSYDLKTCPDGKCVEKVNPPDLSVLRKCQNCQGCNWVYNSTINGYQYICDTCQDCGDDPTKKCGGQVCKGCTDSSQYFQGGDTGAFCEYCTEAKEGCTVYNTNSVGDVQYNTGGSYNPSSYKVATANNVVCGAYQDQTTCNGRNTNPGILDGGVIYEFGIDWLTKDKGECNGDPTNCNVRA